jgi:AbiV family abortive infection protein
MKTQDLAAYSAAALKNGEELSNESALLYDHGHFARAYFLAVAAIEEIGKAIMAFDAQGRNLDDPAVTSKVQRSLANHASKIRSAFIGFLVADPRKNTEIAVELIVQLQRGREPSMYTDQAEDGSISVPGMVVRERSAFDCVRLSKHCLASARSHLSSTSPAQRTRADDQLFALRTSQVSELMNKEDFWWYYISRMEAGQMGYAEAVIQYRQNYALPGKLFKHAAPEGAGDPA